MEVCSIAAEAEALRVEKLTATPRASVVVDEDLPYSINDLAYSRRSKASVVGTTRVQPKGDAACPPIARTRAAARRAAKRLPAGPGGHLTRAGLGRRLSGAPRHSDMIHIGRPVHDSSPYGLRERAPPAGKLLPSSACWRCLMLLCSVGVTWICPDVARMVLVCCVMVVHVHAMFLTRYRDAVRCSPFAPASSLGRWGKFTG